MTTPREDATKMCRAMVLNLRPKEFEILVQRFTLMFEIRRAESVLLGVPRHVYWRVR